MILDLRNFQGSSNLHHIRSSKILPKSPQAPLTIMIFSCKLIFLHPPLISYQKAFHFILNHRDYVELSSKKRQCTVCVFVWWMAINNIIFNNKKKTERDLIAPWMVCCCWRIYALVADVDSLSDKHLLLNDYCSMKNKILDSYYMQCRTDIERGQKSIMMTTIKFF